ncbi:MAG: hypothetical protein WCS15_00875 [Prevotella sp.]|nr:hypothetical protein [Prevotella sp.]MDD4533243.1 hypothetical protein [Prevotella sp.]
MKLKHLFIMMAISIATLVACKGLDPRPAFPPSEEALALKAKYWDKVVGVWTYEGVTDSIKGFHLFEQYHFEADGSMTGVIRWGKTDSTLVTWSTCTVSKDGQFCTPKQSRKFRYIINDSIKGKWNLVHSDDENGDFLTMEFTESSTRQNKRDTLNASFPADFTMSRSFSFCNGEQLFIKSYIRKDVTFKRGKNPPSF